LGQVWNKNDWLYEGQLGFRPAYSCENQVITVFQDIAESLDKRVGTDGILIEFSKAFVLVPCDRLLTKLVASGVNSRVVVLVMEFLAGRPQRVRVEGQLSKEAKVTSDVPQGSVLGPVVLLVCVNDISRNIDSRIRIFADDCRIYGKITNKNDTEKLQTDLDTLGKGQ